MTILRRNFLFSDNYVFVKTFCYLCEIFFPWKKSATLIITQFYLSPLWYPSFPFHTKISPSKDKYHSFRSRCCLQDLFWLKCPHNSSFLYIQCYIYSHLFSSRVREILLLAKYDFSCNICIDILKLLSLIAKLNIQVGQSKSDSGVYQDGMRRNWFCFDYGRYSRGTCGYVQAFKKEESRCLWRSEGDSEATKEEGCGSSSKRGSFYCCLDAYIDKDWSYWKNSCEDYFFFCHKYSYEKETKEYGSSSWGRRRRRETSSKEGQRDEESCSGADSCIYARGSKNFGLFSKDQDCGRAFRNRVSKALGKGIWGFY